MVFCVPFDYELIILNVEADMSTKLSPIISEFETEEAAASYDLWFRAKVAASLADSRPNIPHDQVMAEMRALIESKRAQRRHAG